jgi:hypothetical protein
VLGIHEETQPIVDEPDGAKALLASCVAVLVNDSGFEIEPHGIAEVHPVLGEVRPALCRVPAHHLI